jgi:phage protein D
MGLGIAVAIGGTPDPELSGAAWVEVCERMGEMTTYRMRYDFDISEEGDFSMLVDSRIASGSELAIIAPLDGKNNYLVKGPVTGQSVRFVHGGGGSYLEVTGCDTSVVMDRETKAALWSDLTDSDAVSTIVGKYGYTPDVDATQAGHFEPKHTLVQRDSDLRFVRRLARRNGFLFWITCDEKGAETAHFKRPALSGSPAGNIDINISTNNIASLDLNWDVERPTSVVAGQLNLNDKSDIEGDVVKSPLKSLGAKALADITGDTRSVHVVAPVDDSGDLHARGEGALIESGWFIRAACQTSVNAMKAIVRANTLLNLRGVGKLHSGKYYVASVRHVIDSSAHMMEIELIRNGWGN